MRILIFLIPIFLFLGCTKSTQIELRSIPEGAKIYDTTSKKLIAKTPATVEYLFDNDPITPECEVIPPITAVWGDYEAVITERNIIVCPGKDNKIVINQDTFRKQQNYDLVKYKNTWSITPYFGINALRGSIKIDILDTNTIADASSISNSYKIGFIDDSNRRVEFAYTGLDFLEKDLNLYTIDTIIPISRFKMKIVEPYFRFGIGYASFSYDSKDYENPIYTLGLGGYGYITEDIELEMGISKINHINYRSIAKEAGFGKGPKPDSKLGITNILVGLNYKF